MSERPIEILLVEDNPDDVELTLRALRTRNLADRVKVVSDGAQALDYLQPTDPTHVPPDGLPRLVLLDLKLPRVTGLEVLAQLKASELTKMIPVVVLTSSREERDVVDSYRLGANSYIVKPVNFEELTQAVCELGSYWLVSNRSPEFVRPSGVTA